MSLQRDCQIRVNVGSATSCCFCLAHVPRQCQTSTTVTAPRRLPPALLRACVMAPCATAASSSSS